MDMLKYVHQLMDMCVVSRFWLLWRRCYRHLRTDLCVCPPFFRVSCWTCACRLMEPKQSCWFSSPARCVRISVAPHPRQHLELSVCLSVCQFSYSDIRVHSFVLSDFSCHVPPLGWMYRKSYLIKQGTERRGNLRVTLHNKQKISVAS